MQVFAIRRLPVLFSFLSLLALLAVGCGGGGSPKDVVKGFCEAGKKGKDGVDELVGFMTKKAGEGYKGLMEMEEDEGLTVIKYELGEEKIDGEKATVACKLTDKRGDEEREEALTFHLKMEDGNWRIWGVQPEGKDKPEDFEELADVVKEMKEKMKEMEEAKKKAGDG